MRIKRWLRHAAEAMPRRQRPLHSKTRVWYDHLFRETMDKYYGLPLLENLGLKKGEDDEA